uniref:NADH dehydrogenase subunit 11 n=1 Tax=Cyanoptyche gloeocystis TaxID=77922 RepID=A0A096Y6X3_9EUKA|nr:NADH dehydrogenase subunit 11 [Cyanoptyche gloeocystis]AIM52086.1 NADH dehydrogenase subunit 11 [Cyanoptyche gloeocystis]
MQLKHSYKVFITKKVGALTSKPYAFTARSWELKSFETIDIFDSYNTSIRIDVRGDSIMRIQPKVNKLSNDLITDKIRFSYDGLKVQRLQFPSERVLDNVSLISWEKCFDIFKEKYQDYKNVIGIAGNYTELEATVLFKKFINKIGSENLFVESMLLSNNDLLQPGINISGDNEKKDFILFGFNLKVDIPLLNIKLKFINRKYGNKIYSIGTCNSLSYQSMHLGINTQAFLNFITGKISPCKLKNPKYIIINSSLQNKINHSLFTKLLAYANKLKLIYSVISPYSADNGFNILNYNSCLSHPYNKKKIIYLLNVEVNVKKNLNRDFIVYQGSHGDQGASIADLILPSAAFTEKRSSYINLFSKIKTSNIIFHPPGNSRADWKIFKALTEYFKKTIELNNEDDILKLFNKYYSYNKKNYFIMDSKTKHLKNYSKEHQTLVINNIDNYYLDTSITRSSMTMNKCFLALKDKIKFNFLI